MIVRWLLLPFFAGLLILIDIPIFFLLSWVKIGVYRSFVLAITLLTIVLFSLFTYTPATPPLSARDMQLAETVLYLEQLHQQQPTHRDVLLNLSRMALFMKQTEQARHYYQAAFQLDPNHEHFRSNE